MYSPGKCCAVQAGTEASALDACGLDDAYHTALSDDDERSAYADHVD